MFRKLTSLLFEEEEVISEEDLHNEEEEHYDIPEIKPITSQTNKTSSEKQDLVEEVKTENSDEKITDETFDKEDKSKKKSQKITVDDNEINLRTKKQKKSKTVNASDIEKKPEYQRQEIISPIFGGPEKPSSTEKPINFDQPIRKEEKKSSTKTTVISPMHGMVEEETNEIFDKNLLNYNLQDMLNPKEEADEVQVSLYDFLEDYDDEER